MRMGHKRGGSGRPGRGAYEAAKRRERPKPARRTSRAQSESEDDGVFRVLIAVHRPRYRARAERAVQIEGWEIRALLNKEDPVGLINQKSPNVFIVSDDFGRQKDLGIVKAVQRYREGGMKVVGLFEEPEAAEEAAALCDATLAPPWKSAQLRGLVAGIYQELTGETLVLPTPPGGSDAGEEE